MARRAARRGEWNQRPDPISLPGFPPEAIDTDRSGYQQQPGRSLACQSTGLATAGTASEHS